MLGPSRAPSLGGLVPRLIRSSFGTVTFPTKKDPCWFVGSPGLFSVDLSYFSTKTDCLAQKMRCFWKGNGGAELSFENSAGVDDLRRDRYLLMVDKQQARTAVP